MSTDPETRCDWVADDALLRDYHDREWGVPQYDDRMLFELLILEGAQAGLSWRTVLARREGYRNAFDGLVPARVARFDARDEDRLAADPRIIRHRAKIHAAITNARAFMDIQAEHGSFAAYLWAFVAQQPIDGARGCSADVPAQTAISHDLSRDLRRRGFRFAGPTICYAYMQATGMVNDHLRDCFRYAEIRARDAAVPSAD